jgi:hypothetical protein
MKVNQFILDLRPHVYLCDQVVQAQQARDQQILDLVTAMGNT